MRAGRAGVDALLHGEDGADTHVGVDVRGSVERIEGEGVVAERVASGDPDDVLVFLGCHHAQASRISEKAGALRSGRLEKRPENLPDLQDRAQDLGEYA